MKICERHFQSGEMSSLKEIKQSRKIILKRVIFINLWIIHVIASRLLYFPNTIVLLS